MIDVEAELTVRLRGRHLAEVTRLEHDWAFGFADNNSLSVSCPWRILVEGRIALANSDDGQKFGLPAPVDVGKETLRLLKIREIEQIAIRSDTGDIAIKFGGSVTLEILNMSSGYEGWQIHAAGLVVIALGGGELAMYTEEKS